MKLSRILGFLVVFLGFMGMTGVVWGADCAVAKKQQNSESYTLVNSSVIAKRSLSGSFCDLEMKLGTHHWVVRQCQSNGEFKEIDDCGASDKGDSKCVDDEANGTAKCVSLKKCEIPNDYRWNGQQACLGNDKIGICNGYNGKIEYPEGCTDCKMCDPGEICRNGHNAWRTGDAACYKGTCSEVDSDGNTVVGMDGDLRCISKDNWIEKCTNGKFEKNGKGTKNCGAQNCGETKGVAVCLDKDEILCTKDHISSKPGGDACINNAIYKCPTSGGPDYNSEPIQCTDTQNCFMWPTKPSKCVEKDAPASESSGSITDTTGGDIIINKYQCKYKGTQEGVNTALGCIPVEMGPFMTWLLPKIFGIAGGISFLLMVWGFILIGTSSGDEKKVQGAKETITSAITGLLVCIFALFILRLIAVNILKIPGIN